MKWQWLLVGLLLMGCVAGAGAGEETFQSWGYTQIASLSPLSISLINASVGNIELVTSSPYGFIPIYVYGINPAAYTYAAFDTDGYTDNYYPSYIVLLDAAFNGMCSIPIHPDIGVSERWELKMIGGTPTVFRDGVQYATGPIQSINPSYFEVGFQGGSRYGAGGSVYSDNYLIGESDHHVVGALPSNWSILRDFINPAAIGVYAWNPTTSTWVSMNSHYFYIDADTDTTDNIYTENFKIYNYDYGFVVNTTTIDSTIGEHVIEYSLPQFLTSVNTVSASGIPDGHYYAAFEHSTDGGISQARGDFWVISSGASIGWNQNSYAQDDAATIAYSVSAGYWNTATYSYRVDVVDITGSVKKTQLVNTQTGNVQISDLDATTYPQGVYYAEIIATDSSKVDHIMNYAPMSVTGYIYFTGYVMNAETGAVLSGANINVTQSTSSSTSTSLTGGIWNSSNNWLSGTPIVLNTTLTGYTQDLLSLTALSAKSITLNISLIPSPATTVGTSIGGIVRDNVYSNLIPGASVVVRNTTSGEYQIKTTNIAGYYRADNLYSGRLYDVWSSKTGYGNSTVAQKLAVGS